MNIELHELGTVYHECDNPTCCNPNHLTNSDMKYNQRGMVERDRGKGQFKTGYRKDGDSYVKAKYKKPSDYDRPEKEFICEHCGKAYKSRADKKNAKYCCRQCSAEARSIDIGRKMVLSL